MGAYLVDLAVGAIAHDFDEFKDASWILERDKRNV